MKRVKVTNIIKLEDAYVDVSKQPRQVHDHGSDVPQLQLLSNDLVALQTSKKKGNEQYSYRS